MPNKTPELLNIKLSATYQKWRKVDPPLIFLALYFFFLIIILNFSAPLQMISRILSLFFPLFNYIFSSTALCIVYVFNPALRSRSFFGRLRLRAQAPRNRLHSLLCSLFSPTFCFVFCVYIPAIVI